MTIIVGLKFSKGVIVATDSRASYGELDYVRDQARKIDTLNDKVAVTSCGLAAAIDRIVGDIHKEIEASDNMTIDEIIKKSEDAAWKFFKAYKERLEEEQEGWSIQIFSAEKMIDIDQNGVAEEEEEYLCKGSGTPYAEYILQQRYAPDLTEQECKELAAYVVLETSKIDPAIGGPINLCSIKKGGIKHIQRDEIEEIVENIIEAPTEQQIKVQSIVREIVEARRWINSLFKHRFKKCLLEQNECAISEIQKACKNESDFTSRIAALALLIDGMDVRDVDKATDDKIAGSKIQGSANMLEVFSERKLPKLNLTCITNLRDIHTLRSKKMPIHKEDPRIIQVLLKWEYKIPPNWSHLWIRALTEYRDSLRMLKDALQ